MDYAQLQSDLEAWIGTLSGLPVVWGKEPRTHPRDAYVIAYPGALTQIDGRALARYTYDELTDEYVEQMHYAQRMGLRLQFRSFDQRWGKSARHYGTQFRAKAQSPSRSYPLMGLASLGPMETLEDTDTIWDGRLMSMYEVEVTLFMWAYELNPTDDTGYIRNVHIEGTGGVVDEYQAPVVDGDDDFVVPEETIEITVET